MTPYQYAYQNPINYIDPTGMIPEGGENDPEDKNHTTNAQSEAERIQQNNEYAEFTQTAIDLDGGRYAYKKDDEGTDYLSNGIDAGLVRDKDGNPVEQKDNPGYYVSPTALAKDSKYPESDPRRYYDPEKDAFIVTNKKLSNIGIKKGSKVEIHVLDVKTNKVIKKVEAIVADVGPRNNTTTLEMSPEAARQTALPGKSPYTFRVPKGINKKTGQQYKNPKYMGGASGVKLRVIKISFREKKKTTEIIWEIYCYIA